MTFPEVRCRTAQFSRRATWPGRLAFPTSIAAVLWCSEGGVVFRAECRSDMTSRIDAGAAVHNILYVHTAHACNEHKTANYFSSLVAGI